MVASLFLALIASSAAQAAATVTVTGDDGNPVAIAPGTTIRNMSTKIGIAFPTSDGHFNATFTGPDGVAVGTSMDCYTYDNWSRIPDFRGNGNYTVTLTNFTKADTYCKTPTSTETFVYTVNSSVAITPPPGPFLIRAPNAFATNTLSLPVQPNPGAGSYDVQYALGAVLNPDGSISGSPQTGYVSSTTNTIDLTLSTPGTYTVVMRATNGSYASPWSAPVTVSAIVPFDLDGITFPDSRGPKYSIRGTVRDKSIRGNVSLALARGSKGGKYRSIGKVKISSKSTFTKHFTQRRTGTYRLRVHYAGSALAPAASVIYKIRITRRLFYK
ncbi:hypothetical protein DSM104299_05117 [Baekduia alba]|uniref:hypothetical protein n=1 Tax=Baekduia alba TaxID=2997333 RepID=UPI002341733D|nr:hypothetical protein [Baekduia alba]WCB96359.1 hypothetical protein DSM104299_05117 [Baekduia alba]